MELTMPEMTAAAPQRPLKDLLAEYERQLKHGVDQ